MILATTCEDVLGSEEPHKWYKLSGATELHIMALILPMLPQ